VIATAIFVGISIWEHVQGKSAPGYWFVLLAAGLFCWGAFHAWTVENNKFEEFKEEIKQRMEREGPFVELELTYDSTRRSGNMHFKLHNFGKETATSVQLQSFGKNEDERLTFDPISTLTPLGRAALAYDAAQHWPVPGTKLDFPAMHLCELAKKISSSGASTEIRLFIEYSNSNGRLRYRSLCIVQVEFALGRCVMVSRYVKREVLH
jgi:hypothetical protein